MKNEFLQSIWEDNKAFHTVTFLDDYGNVYDEYSVLHGEYMAQIPHISSYVAVFNGWYSVESGKRLDLRLPILEDVVYVPRWIDANVLLQNGIAIADIDIESVDFDSMKALLDEVIRMKESVE